MAGASNNGTPVHLTTFAPHCYRSLMDEQFWNDFADKIADRVLDRLRGGGHGWIDQSASPLGRRNHIKVVRRRVKAGAGGAAIINRSHLLSVEALREEVESFGKPKTADGERDVAAELMQELRLVGKG